MAQLESKCLLRNDGRLRSEKHPCRNNTLVRHFCLPSKETRLILLWTAIVGFLYYCVLAVAVVVTDTHEDVNLSIYFSTTYAILALIMMLYPVSGLVADVCCGRLKTVVISVFLLGIFFIVLLIAIVLSYGVVGHFHVAYGLSYLFHSGSGIVVFIV